MLKYSLQVLIPVIVILVVGCTTGIKPIPKTILDDVDLTRELTADEIRENNSVIADFEDKLEIMKQRATEDVTEKEELVAEKKVVDDAKGEMAKLTEKVLEKRRKKLIKEEVEQIAEVIKETASEEEVVEILEKDKHYEPNVCMYIYIYICVMYLYTCIYFQRAISKLS